MRYNLKITRKQFWLFQCHIFDLCNYFVDRDYSIAELSKFDNIDLKRYYLYKKMKRSGQYYIFKNLTEVEIDFVRNEIRYWTFDGFERENSEKLMAKRIIKKVDEAKNIPKQRDIKIAAILS